MTESEFLERIDRHLARADEHMIRGNEIMARSNRTMARSNQIMAESNEIHRDLRGFIREMTVRQERVTDRLVRQIDANTAEMKDINVATRLHTQALAQIMDRLQ